MGKNIQMNSDGTGNEVPMEANHKMHNGPKDVKGVDVERQGILEEDETKLNELTEDVKVDHGGDIVLLDYETIVQKQPPPPPLGPIVHWERFLPVRSLNVLLVENDDSTRQLVSALLRNCSYEVTAAADALQAWGILEDFTNRVDLVLTEVTMPGLSGVGLLCKIMSHRTCKNIPVIMMSSNDSVGTVFKCLSKGAVDFLVKPIRKNELKNLWQHVWRRCHSLSGSGSESGIQHRKSTKSKSPDDSDDTDSNYENDNASFGLNLRDGSDNVSGTQSSWTKHAVEDDSPQQVSPPDPLADPYDSTCAQVVHSKHNMPNSPNKECQEQEEVADKNSVGKDLKMGAPRNPVREHKPYPTEKASNVTGASLEKLPECDSKMEINEIVPGPEISNASCGPISQVADLIGGVADNSEAHLAGRVPETHDGFSKISKCKDNTNEDSKELPTFELSLKRLRSGVDGGDHNILRRSDLSAFSRYNSPAAASHARRGPGAICSNPPGISEDMKTESTCSMLNAVTSKKGLIASSNNNDMGFTTKDAFTKLSAHKEKITSISTAKTIYPSLHHMAHRPSANQLRIQEKVDDVNGQAMTGQRIGLHHEIQVQHHHHHYHHYHHHVHSMQQQQEPPPDHDDTSLKEMDSTALQCGSSNMFPESMEITALNYSLNGSASGSNHISNGHNGSSKAVNTGAMNMESDTVVATNGEAGGTNVVDQNRFSQREAALNKFRQKRKERNFGKKVRYQSRKKLAEQRPRVRGQFVRRTTHDHTSREGSS